MTTAIRRRRLAAIAVLIALGLTFETVWGPAGCDPDHSAVTTR